MAKASDKFTDTKNYLKLACGKGSTISVGCVSDTPGSSLDFSIVFVEDENFVGETGPITVQAGSTLDWPIGTPATLYRGKPQLADEPSYQCAGETAYVVVLRMSPKPGTAPPVNPEWTISANVRFPAGVNEP